MIKHVMVLTTKSDPGTHIRRKKITLTSCSLTSTHINPFLFHTLNKFLRVGKHAIAYICGTFYNVGSRNFTQVTRFGSKCHRARLFCQPLSTVFLEIGSLTEHGSHGLAWLAGKWMPGIVLGLLQSLAVITGMSPYLDFTWVLDLLRLRHLSSPFT